MTPQKEPGTECEEMDEWEAYEEDGPMDLEDQLDAAFERAALRR
jgi:hypothetical protein